MDTTALAILNEAFTLFEAYAHTNQQYMQKFTSLKLFGLEHFKSFQSPIQLSSRMSNLFPSNVQHDQSDVRVSSPSSFKTEKSNNSLEDEAASPVEHKQNLITCDLCGETFNFKRGFMLHKRLHSLRSFKCNECDLKFTSTKSLVAHKKKTHLNRNSCFTCRRCPRRFKYYYTLKNHSCLKREEATLVIVDETIKPEPGATVEKELEQGSTSFKEICQQCGRLFNFHTHLKRHMKDHEADIMYPCYFCLQQFTNRPNLSSHVRLHVQPNGTYKCRDCPHEFDAFKELKVHAKHEHNYQEKFVCKKCNQNFYLLKDFRDHLKTHLF